MERRFVVAAALLTIVASARIAAAESTALTVEKLTAGMASSRGVVAQFHEVKELALLDAPLESRGTLYFVPPDRMLRLTTSPSVARLVVDDGRVRHRDAAGSEEIDLAENPVARQFVDNLIVLFNGDLPTLRKRYEIAFTADGAAWELVLTPRRAAMRHFIARIALAGDGPSLSRLVTTEADGDRTTTTFTEVETDHAFTDGELERLFRREDR